MRRFTILLTRCVDKISLYQIVRFGTQHIVLQSRRRDVDMNEQKRTQSGMSDFRILFSFQPKRHSDEFTFEKVQHTTLQFAIHGLLDQASSVRLIPCSCSWRYPYNVCPYARLDSPSGRHLTIPINLFICLPTTYLSIEYTLCHEHSEWLKGVDNV